VSTATLTLSCGSGYGRDPLPHSHERVATIAVPMIAPRAIRSPCRSSYSCELLLSAKFDATTQFEKLAAIAAPASATRVLW
jgi:hypothetical protein